VSLGLPVAVLAVDVNENAIPIQRFPQRRPGYIDVGLSLSIRTHETEATRFARKTTGYEIHLFGKPEPVGSRTGQFSFRDHRLEDALGGKTSVSLHTKHLENVFLGGGSPKPRQDL
jgi:hypothetical protein